MLLPKMYNNYQVISQLFLERPRYLILNNHKTTFKVGGLTIYEET